MNDILSYFCKCCVFVALMYFTFGVLLGAALAPETKEYKECLDFSKYVLVIGVLALFADLFIFN